MATDYNFRIECSLSKQEVFKIAADAIGTEIIENNCRMTLRVPGVWAVITDVEADKGLEARLNTEMLDGYGFVHTTEIIFDHHAHTDDEGGKQAIAIAVAAMLKQIEGNAIFLWNGEKTILQRINGELIVVDEQGFDWWLLKRLDAIGLGYVKKPLQSPFLD